MAAERAPAKAKIVQKNVEAAGQPDIDRISPESAKGRANTVCSILIISAHSRTVVKKFGDVASKIVFPGEDILYEPEHAGSLYML